MSTQYYEYTFRQNNSGGYYVGPYSFSVIAKTREDAYAILQSQPWFTTDHCDCCGERWWIGDYEMKEFADVCE